MAAWAPKRFWTEVAVAPEGVGYAVLLDARPVRTPAKAALILPTQVMADAVAAEWRAVDKLVEPQKMPVTRAANSAIDKVTPQFDEVAGLVAAYGASDLLCYRAAEPPELAEAQAKAWDPMLDWARKTFDAPLDVGRGVIAVAQPAASLEHLTAQVFACTPFELTALHDLVALTGSLVLGLAATRSDFAPDRLWDLSRFDEDWQAERWGVDEEAAEMTAAKHRDFLQARHFWTLCAA